MAVKTIRSVDNALTVMEGVASSQPIGVSALARLLDLDKNAVQRILLTLGQAGWIRQVDSGEWQITSRPLQIGTRYIPGLRDAARPHLEQLQRDSGETVLLFARDGLAMVVLDAIDSGHALRMTVPVGTAVPISRSGAFDSFLSDADRDLLAAGDAQAEVTDRASAQHLADVRSVGYFVLDDLYPNAIAAGAPVFNAHATPVACVTVVGPRARVDKTIAHRFGELSATTAAAISASIGAPD